MKTQILTRPLSLSIALAMGVATLVGSTGSSFAQADKPKTDPHKEAAKRAEAILAETAEWVDLFNGKDLTGWTGQTEGYIAKDGLLVCQKGAKNLATEKEYGDFAFTFEFKLQESGNNGIGIRVPKGGSPSSDGMEIQILDDAGSRYQSEMEVEGGKKRKVTWLKPAQMHASIYGIYPARTGHLKPVGEWNTQTIIAIEDHIIVIVNGTVVVDAFLDDITPVDGNPHPGMKNKTGHLMLAGHSDHVEFRNLKIADYSVSPLTANTDKDNTPPAGFKAMFNGKDLDGWKGLAHKNAAERYKLKGAELKTAQAEADKIMRGHWSVVEGILTYDGTGQSLCSAKDYGDFEFYIDWKIPAGADSGIYLRGAPQVQIWDPWDPRVKEGEQPPSNSEEWVNAYTNGRNLGSGGLWNNKHSRNMPLKRADKKPGEWNSFLIRMVGEKVSIWLNETLVVDRVRLENYWDKTGTVPLIRADQIELQHHGSELFFKNLYIRELPY